MPTIPRYNQGATEEAGLTRAKKRVISLMEQGILRLTEKPAVDLTNGKADDYAEVVIRQMEEISSILRTANLLFEESENVVFVENVDDARKALRAVIIARKLMRRLLRELGTLAKGITYIDLGLFADLKTAWKELDKVFQVSYMYFTNVNLEELNEEEVWEDVESEYGADEEDEDSDLLSFDTPDLDSEDRSRKGRRKQTLKAFKKIADFEAIVMQLYRTFLRVDNLMQVVTANFNASRQQKVSAPEEIADEKSGSGFRKPLYRIGNNVMSAMYELDGLPRYI
jgi:hypothetical protein